ncbi:MAG: hypothetical protein ACI4OT_05420 [Bacilli bacterium]
MKKQTKEQLQKEIDNLKENISNYTGSDTINNILKSKKEQKLEYKKVKKEHFKNTNIKNLMITGDILFLIVPIAICGGVTFHLMDNMGTRPYVNDTSIEYAYTETEADTNGKFNEETKYDIDDPNFKYITPWKENDGEYIRETFEYNKDLFKNMSSSEIIKLDDEIIEEKIEKNKPNIHKVETKKELTNQELQNNNSYIYSKKGIIDPKNYTETKNSSLRTFIYSIIHILTTLGSSFLVQLMLVSILDESGAYVKLNDKYEYYDKKHEESKIKLKETKKKYKSLKK